MARRLTDEELQARQDRIDELTMQINELREERNKLVLRQRWVRCNRKRCGKRKNPVYGLAVELFGKRRKDLTPDELREYNRVAQQRRREWLIANEMEK